MITGFRHTGIVVNDMELQLKFYRDLLGLEVYYDQYEEGKWLKRLLPGYSIRFARIVKLKAQNQPMVELLHFDEWTYNTKYGLKPVNEVGITHMALTVDNIHNMAKILTANGVTLLSPPKNNPSNTAIVCFCRDFEDNLIELVEENP